MAKDIPVVVKQRNYVIDLERLLFIMLIVMFHSRVFYREGYWFHFGNMGVEFFFVTSGILMAKTVKEKYLDSSRPIWEREYTFLFQKFKGVFPYVLLGYFVIFVEKIIFNDSYKSFEGIIRLFFKSFWELIFLRMAGLTNQVTGMNDPAWYLSAMFIAMFILFPFLVYNYNFFARIIAPAIALIIVGFLMQNYGTIVCAIGEYDYFSLFGMKRAIAEISYGIFIFENVEMLKLYKGQYTKIARLFLSLFEIFGIVITLVAVWRGYGHDLSPVVLLFLGLSIGITFLNESIFTRSFNSIINSWIKRRHTNKYSVFNVRLYELCTSLFLSHYEVIWIIDFYKQKIFSEYSYPSVMICYVAACVAVAYINVIVVKICTQKCKKIQLRSVFLKQSNDIYKSADIDN
ncbi:MAG: acyltransferase family protein [Pseudobutyrivibrio sp.]|nr:acyltransferase family protein [Pseudobutyrivibrio sp.]